MTLFCVCVCVSWVHAFIHSFVRSFAHSFIVTTFSFSLLPSPLIHSLLLVHFFSSLHSPAHPHTHTHIPLPHMVADTNNTAGQLLTGGRLLVATFLLPETISFQVPTREKDGRFRSAAKSTLAQATGCSNNATSLNPSGSSPTHVPAGTSLLHPAPPITYSRPAASINPLSAVDTSNGAMSDQTQRSSPPRKTGPRDMALSPTSILVPPAPSSPVFYRSASSTIEAVTTLPKPIGSKADRLKAEDRPAPPQRSSFHGQNAVPPPSILARPSESKETNVFPTAAPRPTLNQPRSRTSDHPSLHIHSTQPQRRSSIDSAKVFAEAAWTVEKANGGNIGLHNAVNSIQSQLAKRIWVGTLGMATDTLPDRTRGDIKSELALNHSSIPVFVNDLDFEGHYHQFCKQVQ